MCSFPLYVECNGPISSSIITWYICFAVVAEPFNSSDVVGVWGDCVSSPGSPLPSDPEVPPHYPCSVPRSHQGHSWPGPHTLLQVLAQLRFLQVWIRGRSTTSSLNNIEMFSCDSKIELFPFNCKKKIINCVFLCVFKRSASWWLWMWLASGWTSWL